MGVRLPSVATSPQQSSVTLVTTAETVVATLPPISLSLDNAQILLFWCFTLNTALGSTGVVIRIRRGTTVTGTQINLSTGPAVVAASLSYYLSGCYADVPGIVANQQYVVTAAVAGSTANPTVTDPVLIGMML